MLSQEHKVLYAPHTRDGRYNRVETKTAKEIVRTHEKNILGFRGRFYTTFILKTDQHIPLSDADIRVMVMVIADGHINRRRAILGFKKERKIARAKLLLDRANIPYVEKRKNGLATFRFTPPILTKSYCEFWKCNAKQLETIVDECFHWDGNLKTRCFYSSIESSADFIQYAMTTSGYRAVKRCDVRNGVPEYRVFANTNLMVGMSGSPKTHIEIALSKDGFQYCFTVPSGFFVIRRCGNVAITGNCGMLAAKTNLKLDQLDWKDLGEIRDVIEAKVPVGTDQHKHQKNPGENLINGLSAIIQKHPKLDRSQRAWHQVGTLGGGNHFIEICYDQENAVWIMLHSGSRNIGNHVGNYFINLAREDMRIHFINLPDKDLAYLSEGTQHFNDYIEAVSWCQDYARANRNEMLSLILGAVRGVSKLGAIVTDTVVNCHHNYVEREHHFGQNVLVTRKGAVRARIGDLAIIPGSMGARSYIVRGKGNPESFMSCSHGAGRAMSRSEAKKRFSIEDHKQATEGVNCRKDSGVLDETPKAYKDIDAVIAAQADLIDVVATLKQVVCVKG